MTTKPVIPRAIARRDVEQAIDHYLAIADSSVALNLIDGLERAYAQISSYPASGSPRFSFELGIPDLRHMRIKGFPYLIFYVELASHIDIWRVLHTKRDIPAWIPAWLDDPDSREQ